MTFRKRVKRWLYGSCPGLRGRFPYFGTKVYFPPGSLAFVAVCNQGSYEPDNARVLQAMTLPDTWLFDVGANLGLMSIPVLAAQPKANVLSFEPSKNSLPYLRRSIAESPYGDRWQLVPKAVGERSGRVGFALASPENALFDGLLDTARVAVSCETEVEMTTLDTEWERLGRPAVSAIKIDVEGAELRVLDGAARCLASQRPALLLEWSATNLPAYNTTPESLLVFAESSGYRVHTVPHFVAVTNWQELRVHMAFTENFLLLGN